MRVKARKLVLISEQQRGPNATQDGEPTLKDWLLWLESLHPKKIDLGLDRIAQVADRLGLRPHTRQFAKRYPDYYPKLAIIAGTNGKGSCVESLTVLADQLGISHGSYTSPHVLSYNERFRINRKDAASEAILKAFKAINEARLDGEAVSLSYFEFATLTAFYLFAEAQLDFWIIEVGLGGRLDATNIIDADLAIITAIALDHEAILGSDIDSIAREKAGVLRPAQLCVLAERSPPQALLDQAESLMTERILNGSDYQIDTERRCLDLYRLPGSQDLKQQPDSYDFCPFLPEESAAAAFNGFVELFKVEPKAFPELLERLESSTLVGRFSVFEARENVFVKPSVGRSCDLRFPGGQSIVLDVAHNPAAIKRLANNLQSYLAHDDESGLDKSALGQTRNVTVTAIFGMMADKDRRGGLKELAPFIDRWFPVSLASSTRAASADLLAEDLLEVGVNQKTISVSENISVSAKIDEPLRQLLSNNAGSQAEKAPSEGDHILLIFGSFHTVQEALEYLTKQNLLNDVEALVGSQRK